METIVWGLSTLRRGKVSTTDAVAERQGPVVLAIFLITQVLDGAFTYWGVSRFGIELEMNALLAAGMIEMGPGATLFAAKSLACACGILLYVNAYLRPLAAVAGLCLGLAVIPWMLVAIWHI